MLYNNKKSLTQNVYLPIKLIVTDDNEVTNNIIKATNRQTEVKIEAFEALSPFHKKLEEFYASFDKDKDQRLYYERRSKQYEGQPIRPDLIISIPIQINCFLSMFLNEPHSTHRYYGELLKSYRHRIFLENHGTYPYYISGYGLYVVDKMFKNKLLNPLYKRFRYHLLMIARLLIEESQMPALNNKQIDVYCEKIRDILWDNDKSKQLFNDSIFIIESALKDIDYDLREATRRRTFTSDLIDNVGRKKHRKQVSIARSERERGRVKMFSYIKGYGFIEPDIFVYFNDILDEKYPVLNKGDLVEYEIIDTSKGRRAINVSVIQE